MKLPLRVALLALVLAGAAHAQTYTVLCMKTPCGELKQRESAGRLEVDYAYRNNGRGPTLKEVLEFAPDGAWTAYRGEGVSTSGARIAESFELKDGLIRDLGLNLSRSEDLLPRYAAALDALEC